MKLKNLVIMSLVLLSLVLIVSAGDPYRVDENMELGTNDIYNVSDVNSTRFWQNGSAVLDSDDINGTTFNHSTYSDYALYATTNVTCSDCLGTSQIQDIYVLNSGDTMTGSLRINSDTALSIRGNQNAIDYENTSGDNKWLVGLREDLAGNADDFIFYGYGGKVVFQNSDVQFDEDINATSDIYLDNHNLSAWISGHNPECVVDAGGNGDYSRPDDAIDAGCQNIYIKKGEYIINETLYFEGNMSIVCEEKAVLKMADNFPVHLNHYEVFSNRNRTDETSFYTVENLFVGGCEIDGNKANNAGSSEGYTVGLFCYNCDNVYLDNLYVHNVHGAGIIIDDSETYANQIYAYNNNRCGISFNNYHTYGVQQIINSKMKFNRWGLCLWSDAITIVQSSEMSYNTEQGVKISSVSSESVNGSNKILIGNDIRHNTGNGIVCIGEGGYYCNHNSFYSNYINNNDGISINETDNSSNNLYVGNLVDQSILINTPSTRIGTSGNINVTLLEVNNPPSACSSANSFLTYWKGSSATCTSINDSLVNANSSNYWDNFNSPTDITSLGTISSATSITTTNLIATNLEGNIDGTGYNITLDYVTATLTGNADSATSWDSETSQADLNVNSSNYWDGLNVPSDLNDKITLQGENITAGTVADARLSSNVFLADGTVPMTSSADMDGNRIIDQVKRFDDEYGLVSFYALEDGSATDYIGTNSVTIDGATETSNGRVGDAFTFDGTNDKIYAGSSASFNISNEITISTWVKIKSTTDWWGIVDNYDSGGYRLGFNGANKIRLLIRNGTGGVQGDSYSDAAINLSEWTNVVGMNNGTHNLIYVNGVLAMTPVSYATGIDGWGSLNIGHIPSAGKYFNGTIDEVRVYNRSLSSKEIEYNYLKDKSHIDKSLNVGFDQNITISSGNKICLDGDTCAVYILYNGSCIISSNGGCI